MERSAGTRRRVCKESIVQSSNGRSRYSTLESTWVLLSQSFLGVAGGFKDELTNAWSQMAHVITQHIHSTTLP